MIQDDYIKDIARELIDYSQNYGEDELRSRSEQLFPAIFVASQRISGRAISRWLNDEKEIKFSPASVGNVLRDQEKYFKIIAERVQPMAEHLAYTYGFDVKEYLYGGVDSMFLAHLDDEAKFERQVNLHEGLPDIEKYIDSLKDELKEEWFELDQQIRFRCLPYFKFDDKQSVDNKEGEANGNK